MYTNLGVEPLMGCSRDLLMTTPVMTEKIDLKRSINRVKKAEDKLSFPISHTYLKVMSSNPDY